MFLVILPHWEIETFLKNDQKKSCNFSDIMKYMTFDLKKKWRKLKEVNEMQQKRGLFPKTQQFVM